MDWPDLSPEHKADVPVKAPSAGVERVYRPHPTERSGAARSRRRRIAMTFLAVGAPLSAGL